MNVETKEERDRAATFGAAVAIRRQLLTKLDGVDTREVLWAYVLWLEGKDKAPDGHVVNVLKSMRLVEELIKDTAP